MKYFDGEFCCRMVVFPGDIHGATKLSHDEFPNIYINDLLSPQARRAAFLHEMRHLEQGDFYNSKPIEDVEGSA